MIRWPWTNLHELNLDWIIQKMKELEEKVKEYATNVSASATTGAPGSQAAASVTGDLNEGLNFSFTIPQGAQGPQGETGLQGPQGPQGPPGSGTFQPLTGSLVESVTFPAGSVNTVRFELGPVSSYSTDNFTGIRSVQWGGAAADVIEILNWHFEDDDNNNFLVVTARNIASNQVTVSAANVSVGLFW